MRLTSNIHAQKKESKEENEREEMKLVVGKPERELQGQGLRAGQRNSPGKTAKQITEQRKEGAAKTETERVNKTHFHKRLLNMIF